MAEMTHGYLTDRERRLREALETIRDGAEVDISSLAGNEGVILCCYCGAVPHSDHCPAVIATAALADQPPTDQRDCPKCDGWAETKNGNDCDRCGATGEVPPPDPREAALDEAEKALVLLLPWALQAGANAEDAIELIRAARGNA